MCSIDAEQSETTSLPLRSLERGLLSAAHQAVGGGVGDMKTDKSYHCRKDNLLILMPYVSNGKLQFAGLGQVYLQPWRALWNVDLWALI